MSRLLAPLAAKNASVLALALLGSIPYGWRAAASVAVGGGVQAVNLAGLERSVRLLARLAVEGRGGPAQILLASRFLILVGSVGLVLYALPVEPLAFAIGLSTAVPAVLWHGLATAPDGKGA
jgi:hypothetical protein